MPRSPRIWTQPNAGVEVMNRCLQGRHLTKPGPRLNPIIIGALAKTQEKYPVEIHSGVFMDSHFLCAAAHKKCYVQHRIMWSSSP